MQGGCRNPNPDVEIKSFQERKVRNHKNVQDRVSIPMTVQRQTIGKGKGGGNDNKPKAGSAGKTRLYCTYCKCDREFQGIWGTNSQLHTLKCKSCKNSPNTRPKPSLI